MAGQIVSTNLLLKQVGDTSAPPFQPLFVSYFAVRNTSRWYSPDHQSGVLTDALFSFCFISLWPRFSLLSVSDRAPATCLLELMIQQVLLLWLWFLSAPLELWRETFNNNIPAFTPLWNNLYKCFILGTVSCIRSIHPSVSERGSNIF